MSERLRILIVEDNPADADFVHEMLSEAGSAGFQTESVARLSKALTRLESKDIDLILLDLSLPDSQGLQTFHTLRNAAPDIPVIVLTGNDDQELAVAAVRDGAQDYLVKGQIGGSLLARAARYAVARHKAEEDLRDSRALYFSLVENMPQSVFRKDRAGHFLFVNERFCRDLRRSPADIIGRTDADFFPAELAQAYRKDDLRVMETGQVLDQEEKYVGADGRELFVQVIKMPLRDAQGQIIGIQGVFWNITKRKCQERELIEKSIELERFTYTVSHDLKSPLVTVKTFLGYLELDMAGADQERIKQDLTYMHNAADKMGRLLDELLNLARIGRKMNPAERVTFKKLAGEAVGLLAGRIITSDAVVQVADASVVLEGDRSRLVEIWLNLVENACKFRGDQPRPHVEIGVEQRGGETVFFVRDNGMGIDPRHQAKVFNLFEKLNPKIEGAGMGLALVKRVVELYQGRIWVESGGLGHGANFLFTLPAAVVAGILPAVSSGILPPGPRPNEGP
jgi:PAS domain S-box-containing protein